MPISVCHGRFLHSPPLALLEKKQKQSLTRLLQRGLIFHGPPGNGKTISIKAMMKDLPHPSLYVKSFHTWNGDETGIKMIFNKARAMAPCLLILEDIDSLVNMSNRSFFLNEVDGLEDNDGILILATTNYCMALLITST